MHPTTLHSRKHHHVPLAMIAGLFFVAIGVYSAWSFSRVQRQVIYVAGTPINVEVANTVARRTQGLSGHPPLGENEGMLFIFDKPDIQGFWMKDMLFPIDIIWFDADGKVTHIEHSISPDTYPLAYYPTVPSLFVLELRSGKAAALGLEEGQSTLKFNK